MEVQQDLVFKIPQGIITITSIVQVMPDLVFSITVVPTVSIAAVFMEIREYTSLAE